MQPASGPMVVPACGTPKAGEKLYGYEYKFVVPKHIVRVSGGKWDVDYVCYRVVPKTGDSSLSLCFAGNGNAMDPSDEVLSASSDFIERNVVMENGKVVGRDSSGHLKTGEKWRTTAMSGGGGEATYRGAPTEAAALFDRIINSICTESR
jgi:hypothetical protein